MSSTTTRTVRRAALGLGALLVLSAVLAAVLFRLDGGRWFIVETPSMGQSLPVGSLVLTQPTELGAVANGDVITFRNPESGVVYTHRVARVTDAGLRTRGDINATVDPWVVGADDLVGAVSFSATGLGWAVRGLPLFFVGLAVMWLLTIRVAAPRRYSWRVVGVSLSLAVTTFVLKPWVGLERMTQAAPTDGSRGVLLDVVSTGLLPIEAFEPDGPAAVSLVGGQVGTLHLTTGADTGAYDVLTRLDLPFGWWVALVLFCLLPLIWTLAVGLVPHEPEPAFEPAVAA